MKNILNESMGLFKGIDILWAFIIAVLAFIGAANFPVVTITIIAFLWVLNWSRMDRKLREIEKRMQ